MRGGQLEQTRDREHRLLEERRKVIDSASGWDEVYSHERTGCDVTCPSLRLVQVCAQICIEARL